MNAREAGEKSRYAWSGFSHADGMIRVQEGARLAGAAVAEALAYVAGQQAVDEVAALRGHLLFRQPLDAPVQDVVEDLLREQASGTLQPRMSCCPRVQRARKIALNQYIEGLPSEGALSSFAGAH